MSDDRLAVALARVVNALDRLETALPAPATDPATECVPAERHARLRDAMEAAASRLDRLLGD